VVSTLGLALVPVVVIAAAGAILARATRLDVRAIHVFAYWVAGPALVFRTVLLASLGARDFGLIALFSAAAYAGLLTLAAVAGRLLHWDREKTRAAALALASTNCANYGLPVVAATFGAEGLAIGTAFVSVHIIVHVALGGTYAGWDSGRGFRDGARRVLAIPYLYAVGLALGLRALVPGSPSSALPASLDATLSLLGQTWIPLLILLLGAELAAIPSFRGASEALPLATAKLLIPPALACGLAALCGLEGTARTVLILQASMPTAVNGVVFAKQFGVRPALVAMTLALSTVGSLVTLPLLLSVLE
jgi:predicted permease